MLRPQSSTRIGCLNFKPHGENIGSSSMPNCIRCDTKHDDKYLTSTDDCFNYGKSGHKIRDYPLLPTKERDGMQA